MNDRIIIGPDEYLIETVADLLMRDGKDYSEDAAVFPGKRPAHFLRKELARRTGSGFIPPRIYSLDEFVKMLHQKSHPDPVRYLGPIDAVTLLYHVHTEMKERLGGEYFTSLDSFIPIGLKLFSELEDLKMARLSEKKLKDTLSTLSYNRLFSLPEYFVRFYKLLSDNRYSTPGLCYSETAERIQNIVLDEFRRLVIIDLFKHTRAEKDIYEGISKNPSVHIIYQSDKSNRGGKGPEIEFIKGSDTHGQVFALSALIKNEIELGGPPDEKSVIVLPSADALFPLLHQTLSLIPQDNYNIALGYPIMRTPVYGFLYNLMELLSTRQGGRYSAVTYLKFILHPYAKNIRFRHRADVTRILFHAVETMITENDSIVLVSLEDIENADDVFTKVAAAITEPEFEVTPVELKNHIKNIHLHTIRAMEQIGSLKELAHNIIGILTYIYDHSTARLHPLFRRYAESLLQIFMEIEGSLAGPESFKDTSGYFNFIQQYVSHKDVPFTGTPLSGLQVLGLLETRGLYFDNVYLLNANDNVLPGTQKHDMLLPQKLRKDLGLLTYGDKDELSEYYFNLLVNGAKRVHIFYEESGENDKSRFVERMMWERQKKEGKYSPGEYIKTVRYNVKLAGDELQPAVKSDKILAKLNGFTYSSSALDSYLRCQLQFFYRYILRLEEKEEAVDEPDDKEIGSFVHKVLAEYFRPMSGRRLQNSDLDNSRMGQIIDRLFEEKFGTDPAGAAFLIKRQVRRRLQLMLTDYQQKLLEASGIKISGVEERLSVNMFGEKFYGIIDRIEERGDKIFILDYKTGKRPSSVPVRFKKLDLNKRESWTDAVTSLQLPVYLLLYCVYNKIETERVFPAYLYLGENSINRESEMLFPENEPGRADNVKKASELIMKIINEIKNESLPFLPPEDFSKACPQCPFTRICGTGWVQK